jgi:Uma2 family endonuclease
MFPFVLQILRLLHRHFQPVTPADVVLDAVPDELQLVAEGISSILRPLDPKARRRLKAVRLSSMSSPRHVHYTYAEYLALEGQSAIRHEYLDGEIYAMGGGTPDHSALGAAVIGLLRAGIPASCRVYTSELRVRTATGLTTDPDAAVVCGPTWRANDDSIAVTNPSLLVEVTSPSTEDYDRGEKLRHYKSLPTVQEILIVSHQEARLTLHRRHDGSDDWETTEATADDSVGLVSVGTTLAVDDVYRGGLEDVG